MHPRIIAIPCDRNYFPGLQALINSVHVYHPELPIIVFERGFQTDEFEWLSRHLARIEVRPISRFPYPAPGMWEAKQQVPAECIAHARTVCVIDADIVLLSRIDDVFEAAEDGKVVAGDDGAHSYFNIDHQVYGPTLVGKKYDQTNTGLLCFDVRRHWDLAGMWAFSSNYGAYSPHGGYPIGLPGFGDQGLFDGLVALLHKEGDMIRLPIHSWHDFRAAGYMKIRERLDDGQLVVDNEYVGERQRIAHCVGYKWWMPKADDFHLPDDRLECFRHFARVRFGGSNGAEISSQPQMARVELPALMVIHCAARLEKRQQVEACLRHWRRHHPAMPGLLISDGAEPWHREIAESFGLEYHEGVHCRTIRFGALWLNRYLTLALDVAGRAGCEMIWKIHPDTLIQRPFVAEPPDADWFGCIHNEDAPHVHGGSSFLRVDAARKILARIGDCTEFSDSARWMPTALSPDIRAWAEDCGWVSAEFIICAIGEEVGLKSAAWAEIHSGCGLTPLPDNHRRYAVLHPVKLPRKW